MTMRKSSDRNKDREESAAAFRRLNQSGNPMDRKRQRRNTLILAVSVLAAAGVLYSVRCAMRSRPVPDSGRKAVIQIDGEKIHTMDLDQDAEYTVKTKDGHYNTVTVKDGCVSVREADCKNQVCVNTAAARYPGEVIACLPHRMIVYISQEVSSASADGG